MHTQTMAIVDMQEIKRRAEACGCSLKDLAIRAGIQPSTCYRALKGNSDVRTSTALRLTNALRVIENRRRDELQALA